MLDGGMTTNNNNIGGMLADNKWHHVTVVSANNSVTFYIDGVLDKTIPVSVSVAYFGFGPDPRNFKIGTADGTTNFYEGQLDEFRVWNRALGATEVSNLSTKEVCGGSVTGLVAYYRINQGSDGGNNTAMNYLIDDSPSGVEGTLNNFGLTNATSNFTSASPYLSVPKPTVTYSDLTTCQDFPFLALEATGENLKWYTTETGGTGVTTTPVPPTDVVQVLNYWVSQTTCLGESQRTNIKATVKAKPDKPTASPTNVLTYCKGAMASAITATGTALVWNLNTVLTAGATYTPSTASAGVQNIYVNQQVNGCNSDYTIIDVTVNDLPTAPSVSAVNVCLNETVTLTATGTNLKWYTAATGGIGSTTAPTPNTATTGTSSYWVTQTNANGCESPRAKLDVTVINNASGLPNFATKTYQYCENAIANFLVTPSFGSNGVLKYYTTAIGGTGSTSDVIPTGTVGASSYWVTQTEPGKCESARTKLDVTITTVANTPPTVVSSSVAYCQFATATQLATTSTGTLIRWYTTATGGIGDVTGGPIPSTDIVGTKSYYLTQQTINAVTGLCESDRTKIDVTVNSTPAPTAPTPQYFQGDIAAPLTATGTNLKWYAAATGGTGSTAAITPSTDNAGIVSYYVTQTGANTCESPRTKVDASILGKATHLNFDGVDDYILAQGVYPDLPGVNTSRTIEMMIKTDQTSVGSLIEYGLDPTTDFKIRISGGTIQVGQGTLFMNSDININDNVWHHLATTFDGTTLKIYIDGVLHGSVPRTLNTYAPFNLRFVIGAANNTVSEIYDRFYKGDMDELRVWNKALTAAEINAHRTCEYLSPYPTELVLYHKFNVGYGGADNTALANLGIKTTIPNVSFANTQLTPFAKKGATSNFLAGSPVEIFNDVVVTTPSVSYAQFAIAQPLTAVGINLKWYTAETGGTALAGTPTPSTTTRGTTILGSGINNKWLRNCQKEN